MQYPNIPHYRSLLEHLHEYANLRCEYGANVKDVENILLKVEESLKSAIAQINSLPIDDKLAMQEPNSLEDIRKLRPDGPRRLWKRFNRDKYQDKLEGALLARMAGCILGAAVEGWSIESMQKWSEFIDDQFPPIDYWSQVKDPSGVRYGKSLNQDYTRDKMDGVPVDDDITYTLLALLIVEDYGKDFTTDDVAKAWIKYLPMACTAEDIALRNIKAGINAYEAADIGNPYCQWIGADIRSDGWAYLAPGYPEKAAEMAYRDAYLSHRRNGIYGEMFFSAAQAAAFEVDNSIDALKIGLTEIPENCLLAREIRWALEEGKNIKDYRDARQAVDDRFKGMSSVHTINNACLTIFGLIIGENDVTKVISQTVAMGLDNDCTTATAGSIVGAIVGKKGIPEHWYKPFNNKIYTYMNNAEKFTIDDVIDRFARQAEIILE
ncbi:MAG: ADP-ribosylglycohydrolase family protein [Clostridiales bacterium]|mgnify:CR=1 FL=1|nr:ADP-ribosylglycohydrolase family protein [Clostridiales bacterium]